MYNRIIKFIRQNDLLANDFDNKILFFLTKQFTTPVPRLAQRCARGKQFFNTKYLFFSLLFLNRFVNNCFVIDIFFIFSYPVDHVYPVQYFFLTGFTRYTGFLN